MRLCDILDPADRAALESVRVAAETRAAYDARARRTGSGRFQAPNVPDPLALTPHGRRILKDRRRRARIAAAKSAGRVSDGSAGFKVRPIPAPSTDPESGR